MVPTGECGYITDLDEYQFALAKRYPEEFIGRYEHLVRREVFGSATGRDIYRRHVALLRRLQQVPGGREAVARIVRDPREAYPRRTALMDELRRLN